MPFDYHVEHSSAQQRWLGSEGYKIQIEPYTECSIQDFANDILQKLQGKLSPASEFSFAKYQSKTSYIWPQLLVVKDIADMERLKAWSKNARVIFVLPIHATYPLKDVPMSVRNEERRWRGWFEENKERVKQGEATISMDEYLAIASDDVSAEEITTVDCFGCGIPVDVEKIDKHKRNCAEYKEKGLADFQVSEDEDDFDDNGIQSQLSEIINAGKNKTRFQAEPSWPFARTGDMYGGSVTSQFEEPEYEVVKVVTPKRNDIFYGCGVFGDSSSSNRK